MSRNSFRLLIAVTLLVLAFSAVAVADFPASYDSVTSRTVERPPRLTTPCPNGVAVSYNTDAGVSGATVRSDGGGAMAFAPGGADAGAGNILYDGSAPWTATCLTLTKDQDYRLEATVPTCVSNGTGRLGSATVCRDLPRFSDSAPESVRFGAAPDGGQPCIHAFSKSGTAGEVQFCPLTVPTVIYQLP